MMCNEFDNPELNELRKKILDEVDKERTLNHSYQTVKKINGVTEKILVPHDFSKYSSIDIFAGKIFTQKMSINDAMNEERQMKKKLNGLDSIIKVKKTTGRKISRKNTKKF